MIIAYLEAVEIRKTKIFADTSDDFAEMTTKINNEENLHLVFDEDTCEAKCYSDYENLTYKLTFAYVDEFTQVWEG